MTAPGNDVLIIVLALAFVIASGYAFGRIHQWYRHGQERDQAYREGYDHASHSLFDMAVRNRAKRGPSRKAAGTASLPPGKMPPPEKMTAAEKMMEAEKLMGAEKMTVSAPAVPLPVPVGRARPVGSSRRRISQRLGRASGDSPGRHGDSPGRHGDNPDRHGDNAGRHGDNPGRHSAA